MTESFSSSAVFLTLLTMVQLANGDIRAKRSVCIPAEEQPVLENSICYPLTNISNPVCQRAGIMPDAYLYKMNAKEQEYSGRKAWQAQELFKYTRKTPIPTECVKQGYFIGCRYMFPSCDRTKSTLDRKTVCKKTCLEFLKKCEKYVDYWKTIYIVENPQLKDVFACATLPSTVAGDSPECWFYNKESSVEDGCLYENGSTYHGNISTTTSGIACQAWTEQCPHRHTMTTTFPELKEAKNYCRNPQNSGQRPWCFTTDMSKRWEYCDIPKCTPVDGGYGNWSLNSPCNVTCGKGFERWTRECNNPETKYGGKSCDDIGESVQYRRCETVPCPGESRSTNWTKLTPCSVTCGDGYEVWTKKCENEDNCTKDGKTQEKRHCQNIAACPNSSRSKVAIIIASIGAGVIIATIFVLILIWKRKEKLRNNRRNSYTEAIYAWLFFEKRKNSRRTKKTSSTNYQNLTENGEPRPVLCRGIVLHQQHNYTNVRRLWYDRLQLFPFIAIQWLRNTWGNVDQFGRHVYDVMQRGRQVFKPYDRLGNLQLTDHVDKGNKKYDKLQRSRGVMPPMRL